MVIEEIFAQAGPVESLEFEDEFFVHLQRRGHYDKHEVTITEIMQVHTGAPRYFGNEGQDRRAPVIMVGPTAAGRFLVIPIEPAGRYGVWRPITAFEANTHHREAYRKGTES
jgi:hypothetical protein